jgi:LuxR family quorum sensing-dependent transcriptional regulator
LRERFDRIVSTELVDVIAAIDVEDHPKSVLDRFSKYLAKFGFATVALGHLSNPAMKLPSRTDWFTIGNWPDEWRHHWLKNNFVMHDPIARMALRTRKPFTWRHAYEHASRDGKNILDASKEFGFKDGLANPIYSEDGPPGCVTLGAETIDLSPHERAAVELLSLHAYMRLESLFGPFRYQPVENLSPREIDVLHYAAAGKTNWEIGAILSISEHSVRDYMQAAQKKLNCASRTHAVAVAIQRSLILP